MIIVVLKIPKDEYPLIKESKFTAILFPTAQFHVPKAYKAEVRSRKPKSLKAKKERAIEIVAAPTKQEEIVIAKDEKSVILDKFKDWLSDVLAKREVGIEEEPPVPKFHEERKIYKRSADKPPYGVMSLMEARRKRRALSEAERLKKEFRKRLDSSDI
jgi:hypothetical protein